MPRDYDSFASVIKSIDPEIVVNRLLVNSSQGKIELEAALLLLEDLVIESEKPPILSTLDDLMEEPILSNGFKKYLREHFCYECWEFWIESKAFRSSFDVVTEMERMIQGFHIYETFIQDGADQQVNISAHFRDDIHKCFASICREIPKSGSFINIEQAITTPSVLQKQNNKKRLSLILSNKTKSIPLTKDLFIRAEAEIKKVLEQDSLKEFCYSELYEQQYKMVQTKNRIQEQRGFKNIHDIDLSPTEWQILLQESTILEFRQNEFIVEQGEYSPYLYMVSEGSAQSVHYVEGTTKVFSFNLENGALFGELTIFSASLRSFSSVRVTSEICKVKRFYLPLVFQYFMYDPVIALRWYCLIGKQFSALLEAIDLYFETGKLDTSNENLISYADIPQCNIVDYSSYVFKERFPELIGQYVLYECDSALQVPLRASKVSVIYITGEYFCYYTKQGKNNVRYYPLIEIEAAGKNNIIYIQTKKRKLSFIFSVIDKRIQVENIINTLIIKKTCKQSTEDEMTHLLKYQPTFTEKDWQTLIEVSAHHSTYRDEDEEIEEIEKTELPSHTKHTFCTIYSFGDSIASQDKTTSRLIRILEGSCRLERNVPIPNEEYYQTTTIRFLGLDEFIGETGFFRPDVAYAATIANEESVKVLEVSIEFIQVILFAQKPRTVVRFYDQFCRSMAKRILQSFGNIQTTNIKE